MDELTQSIYARSGIGSDVPLGTRPVVLVVDFINGFTDPSCAVGSDLTAEVEATKQLLDVARDMDVPIIFTTIAYEPNLKDVGLWLIKMPGLSELQLGSREVEVDARLNPQSEDSIILKKGASAFFGTNLVSVLTSQQIDTVILCGATTSGCIRATAVDLMQNGYPALVPRECVGDRAAGPHESNLFDINAKYANVVSLQEALGYLEERGER
jgi:nicotinamidase-related amidase